MINDDIEDQIREELNAIETEKVLLGQLHQQQAIAFLRRHHSVRNPIGPQMTDDEMKNFQDEVVEEYRDIYNEATSGVEPRVPFKSDDIKLRDLPDEDAVEEYIEEFKSEEYFTEVFDDVPEDSWAVKLVPIESLVAVQPQVTTTAHQDIPTTDDGWVDLLQYCLPKSGKNYLMVDHNHTSDGTIKLNFTSRSPNVNLVGPKIEQIEDRPPGNISVQFEVKARPNYIQVRKFQDRYILYNGYHRCYQLMNAGEEFVPAIVREVSDYEEAVIGQGFFHDSQIMGDIPPLVSDFKTDAAVELEAPSTNKMIRITGENLDVRR